MGIFSFLKSFSDIASKSAGTGGCPLTVDLATFQIEQTTLGAPVSAADWFFTALATSDVFESKSQGLEIGAKGGALDYGVFALVAFGGTFKANGRALALDTTTSEDQVLELFGQPYWIDRSDGEIIYFYEYRSGTVELQFEFPDGKKLGFITLARSGVLSDPEQRRSYGVDKPWPPE